jgi:hypothetical protein
MTLGIAGKEAEFIVLRTTEVKTDLNVCKNLPVVTTIHSKDTSISIKDVNWPE